MKWAWAVTTAVNFFAAGSAFGRHEWSGFAFIGVLALWGALGVGGFLAEREHE